MDIMPCSRSGDGSSSSSHPSFRSSAAPASLASSEFTPQARRTHARDDPDLNLATYHVYRPRPRRRLGQTVTTASLLLLSMASHAHAAVSEEEISSTFARRQGQLLQPADATSSFVGSSAGPLTLASGSVSIGLVRTGLMYVILYSTLASLMFVLASVVVLKHGIASHKRRLPTAWVVGLAMILGLVGSILNTIFWALLLANELSDPDKLANFWVATSAMLFITPLVAHVALIFRLADLHPSTLDSRLKRGVIVLFPVLMTIVRIVAIVIYHIHSHAGVKERGFIQETSSSSVASWALVEQVSALAQLLYTTVVLGFKFHQLGRGHSSSKDFFHEDEEKWSARNICRRLQQGLYATAFSFAFSTVYQIGVVVCRATSVSGKDLGYILVANIYVQVLGAVLATLSSSHRWREDRFSATFQPGESIVRRRSNDDVTSDDGGKQTHTHGHASSVLNMRRVRHLSTCGCDCAALAVNTGAVSADAAVARSLRRSTIDRGSDIEEGLEIVMSNRSDHAVTVEVDSADPYACRTAGQRPKTSDSDATRGGGSECGVDEKDKHELKRSHSHNGRIMSSRRFFSRPGTGDSSRSESDYYAAPLSALNADEERRRSSDITLFPSYANTPWILPGGNPSVAESRSHINDAVTDPEASRIDPSLLSPKSAAFPPI